MSETSADIVVTGTAWMGSGVGSIESALERIFREAEQEIVLTVYSITSGADVLFDWLETTLARGLYIRCIINRFENQHESARIRLRRLAANYPYFHIYVFKSEAEADLHAKAIVADRRIALVGSSNMSRRGFLLNHEIAVLLQGPSAATVAGVID